VLGNERHTLTLTVRGSLDEKGTREFEQAWADLRYRVDGAIWVVDLSEAEIICEQGRQLMSRLTAEGARFRGAGPSVDMIIDLVCREQKEATRLGRRFTSIIFLGTTLTVGIICQLVEILFVGNRIQP
jgi:hypothetical protein